MVAGTQTQITSTVNPNTWYVLGYAGTSSGMTFYGNYTQIGTSTTAIPSSYYIGPIEFDNGAAGEVQWFRTRAYPPNGAMPSTSFGTVQAKVSLSISPNPATYGQSITLTATCAASTSCAIDYPSLGKQIATGTGSATYTYAAYALPAGTYSSFYANDTTLGSNSTAQTLTVNKNSTYIFAWIKKGTNQTWSSTPINTTAQIKTHNNQLSASLYLNKRFIATTTTTTTTQLNKIGFYHYVFNTTGNTNYTAIVNFSVWLSLYCLSTIL